MTARCAYCGDGGSLVEYDVTIAGRVTGAVVLHEKCAPAWKRRRDLGLPASTPNGAPPGPPPQFNGHDAFTGPAKRDANDISRKGGRDEVLRMSDAAKLAEPHREERERNNKLGAWRDDLIDPQKLCNERFPDVKYVVPGIIPEGVTILASRPKLGKSWLILQISTAVASGTVTLASGSQPACGDVLYLALEDNPRRLQRRLTKYFGTQREAWPKRLRLATKWRRLDQGGVDDLREWCKSVERSAMIAIDTIKKVRKPKSRGQSDYDADYEACEGLMKLPNEFPGLSIVVAHHDRKMEADDVFDTVSGTLGLTGGVDTIAVLKRSSKGTTLHVEGRDLVDAVEKAVSFDRETCRWQILGEAAEVQCSAERSRVLTALRNAPEGLSVTELIGLARLGGSNAAYLLLGRMAEAGEVKRVKRGIYGLPGTRTNLSLKKLRQKDRQKPKPLKSQEDNNLSVNLSHPPNRQKSSPGAEQ